jgi:hypothetical protein
MIAGAEKSRASCARRSPGDALKDAGSIPATSTDRVPPKDAAMSRTGGVRCLRKSGSSRASETRPTARDDRVSWYTWYGTATVVSWVPSTDASSPRTRRRRSRDRRSGPKSMSTRRSVRSPNLASSRARTRPWRARSCHAPTRSLNGQRRTADRKAGACPRAAASLADHYHSASEHGIIGRRIETIVAGRFRRRHPGLRFEGAVPRSGPVPEAGRKGMGEWRR